LKHITSTYVSLPCFFLQKMSLMMALGVFPESALLCREADIADRMPFF